MMIMRLVFATCLLLFAGAGESAAGELSQKARAKLHPAFQIALEHGEKGTGGSLLSFPLSVERQADGVSLVDVLIKTSNPDALRSSGFHLNSVVGSIATAQVRLSDLASLAEHDAVEFIEAPAINFPTVDVSLPDVGASLLHAGLLNNVPYKGAGAIVLIYDTGIDWQHPDFRNPQDPTKSRILFLWDQTITAGAGEAPPSGFSYGVEYTKAHIEDELDGTPAGYVREQDTNGHGTHVASTAVGNGVASGGKFVGIAPEADIIVVKGGNASFSESRMIDGLSYAMNKAAALGKPIVVNWSIGSQVGPHDGTRLYEVAINQMVSSAGRAVVVSAGNDGGNAIHVGGTISAGGSATITISVPTYTANSGVQDDAFLMDIWFDGNQSASVTVTSPNSISYTRNAGESGIGPDNSDGTIQVINGISSLNGNRNIYVYVTDQDPAKPPRNGTWTIQISGVASTVNYDGWLGLRTMSGISVTGANTAGTVSMPATAEGAITVASYVTKWAWPASDGNAYTYSTSTDRVDNISTFSSIGPTRDGRQKPDVAAPGQGIVAARSATANVSASRLYPGSQYMLIEGTSMAAPHVTGSTALLMGAFPSLSASQIKTLLTSTAATDAMTGAIPNTTWGYGKLDVLRAMAKAINGSATVSRTVLRYDAGIINQLAPTLSGSVKLALKISPPGSGNITRVLFNTTTPANNPIVGSGNVRCELYTDNGGVPGTQIGNSVDWPLTKLMAATWNSVITTGMNATVSAGTDYFLVLSLTGSFDELKLRTDDGTANTGRSLRFDGSQWTTHTSNFRIRVEVTNVSGLVKAERISEVPTTFELSQNFPNPFNPRSTISYQIPVTARVSLKVFDVVGRLVATLVDQEQTPGKYSVTWDGTDSVGDLLASGIYFYRLDAAGFSQTRKMILLK